MRVPVDLSTRRSNNLQGLFFDTAVHSDNTDMKSRAQGLRCAADDEWSVYRDIITSYYVDDDLPLKDVMHLMEVEYGFRSTPKVYKTKMSEWGVQKNLSRIQRDAAVKAVEAFVSQHGFVPKVTFHGKPVPLARLRRQTAGQKIKPSRRSPMFRSESEDSEHSDTIELDDLFGSDDDKQMIISPRTPTAERLLTPEIGDIDKVLRCVSAFTNFCSDTYFPPQTLLSIPADSGIEGDPAACKAAKEFWSSVVTALNELEGSNNHAFTELEQACQHVSTFMRMPPTSLFRYLLIVLGNDRWESYPEVRQHMMVYLAHMANETLGPEHPVTIALCEFQDHDTFSKASEAIMRIAVDGVEARLGPAHTETLWFKRSLVRILRRRGDADTAEQLLQTTKKQCEIASGPYSRQTRICLEGLGQLYMQEGKLEEAEGAIVELVRKADKTKQPCKCHFDPAEKPDAGADSIVLYAKRNLAFLAQARGDELLQAYWFAKEMEMVKQHGLDMDWMLGTRAFQEKKFFETGKFKYVTQLKGYMMPVENRTAMVA